MCLKVNSAPSACFTRHGKCQKSLWFTGCQEWFYREIKQSSVAAALSLIDLKRNVEDFSLRELSRHPPLLFDSFVWGSYAQRDGLCVLAQAQTWLAGTQAQQLLDIPLTSWPFTAKSVLDDTHRVIWLNLQSWSGNEELNVCCEKKKKKKVLDLIETTVSMLLGVTFTLVTPLTPI